MNIFYKPFTQFGFAGLDLTDGLVLYLYRHVCDVIYTQERKVLPGGDLLEGYCLSASDISVIYTEKSIFLKCWEIN